jgi:orotate phosphoribosyltransferase
LSGLTVAQLLKRYAYKTGEFKLASGATSTEYLDVKTALHHPFAANAIAAAVVTIAGPTVEAVAGVALGGVPLATLVCQMLSARRGRPIPQLTVRTAAKEHGTGALVEGLDNVKPASSVLLVEDVVTSGASTAKAVLELLNARLHVVQVVAVVDREAGGMAALAAQYPLTPLSSLTTLTRVREAAVAYRA